MGVNAKKHSNTNMAPKTPNDAGLYSELFPCLALKRASSFPAEIQSNKFEHLNHPSEG